MKARSIRTGKIANIKKNRENALTRLTVVSGMLPEKIINEVNVWKMTNRAFVERSAEAARKEETIKGKQKIGVIVYTKLKEDFSKKGIELSFEQCKDIFGSVEHYRVIDKRLRSMAHE